MEKYKTILFMFNYSVIIITSKEIYKIPLVQILKPYQEK